MGGEQTRPAAVGQQTFTRPPLLRPVEVVWIGGMLRLKHNQTQLPVLQRSHG